jgi:hypothetical protein
VPFTLDLKQPIDLRGFDATEPDARREHLLADPAPVVAAAVDDRIAAWATFKAPLHTEPLQQKLARTRRVPVPQ